MWAAVSKLCPARYLVLSLLSLVVSLNLSHPVHASTSVVINEFMAHPSAGNDWVELYNSSTDQVDLNGWKLVDSTSTMKTLTETIYPNSTLVIYVSNRLNNSGDTITLQDPTGTTIDSYAYSSDPGIDVSITRTPDGGTWQASPQTPSPSTSDPTPTPTPTPSPSPSPTTSSKSSFVISQIPQSLNSSEAVSAKVDLFLPKNPNTTFYLKGAFVKPGSTNYFGLTKAGSSWIKNSSSYSSQRQITTDGSGYWSGSLEVKVDAEDSGFTGSGNYIFKVGRYSDAGSGPTWSNEVEVSVEYIGGGEGGEYNQDSETTSLPSPTTFTAGSISKSKVKSFASPNLPLSQATVAGLATNSTKDQPPTQIASFLKPNWYLISGGFLVFLLGLGSVVYLWKRK